MNFTEILLSSVNLPLLVSLVLGTVNIVQNTIRSILEQNFNEKKKEDRRVLNNGFVRLEGITNPIEL